MKGLTDHLFRTAFADHFGGFDLAVAPFISSKRDHTFKPKYVKDVLPENNTTLPVVPQILSNVAEDFTALANHIFDLGYGSVNWNLGCPSRTVTGKKRGADESVYELFGKKPNPSAFPVDEIQKRVGLQMVNEAARCLEEEILRSPRDGDIGAIFGLGFPPFTGGPFRYVDTVGAGEVVRRLERLADKYGERFEPAQILRDYAKAGKKFRLAMA